MTDGLRRLDPDIVPCGIAVFDDNGIILDVNRTLAAWLAVERGAVVGRSLETLFPPGGKIFLQTHFLPLLHGGAGVQEIYFALRTSNGEDLPVLLNASRRTSASDTAENVAAFMVIANRHQFEDTLLQALRSEQEAGESLAAHVEELKRIEEDLERASAVKDEFLGLVSHELRSPLAAMSGAVSLLRRRMGELDEATRQELLDDLARECMRLLALVEDMLIVARSDLNQTVDLEPVLLQRLVPSILAGDAAPESVALEAAIDPDLPPVEANPGFVEQIITNFFTNARKYGKEGGRIAVSVRAPGNGVAEITVANEGEPLDDERIARFFEPFFREERAQARGGLGLGLSVCQRLAQAQGGRVRAKPREGGGLEITLVLPLLALDE